MTARERQRRSRAKRKAEALAAPADPRPDPIPPDEPVAALAAWSTECLKVPPGHPSAGQPMTLPPFAIDVLRAGWDAHESALCVARKNAKSAVLAVLCLGHLVGPIRAAGWRGAVCSLSKDKAAELLNQAAAIATASGLPVTIRRSPYPGHIESETGQLQVLSADRSAGHASSFDLVCIDETGLMPERARQLLAGLRSSVSAKAGRCVHISVRGDSPLFAEVLDNPNTIKQVHEAPADCALDDRKAWDAANPGLGTIKQTAYMEAEARRVADAPGDQPSFRAFDLNANLSPTSEMILSVDQLTACFVEDPADLPPRAGPCVLGFDFGEAVSATAACAIWPETGRLETWMAFGSVPDLAARGRADSAPYEMMAVRRELRTYPGRVVKVQDFLADVAADLSGEVIAAAGADSYKDSEAADFLDYAGLPWPITFRRVGAGKQGGADVRAFQRLLRRAD